MHGSYRPRRRWLRWFLVYAGCTLAVALIGLVIEAAVSPGPGQPQNSSSAFPISPSDGRLVRPATERRQQRQQQQPQAFRPDTGDAGTRAGQRRVPGIPA